MSGELTYSGRLGGREHRLRASRRGLGARCVLGVCALSALACLSMLGCASAFGATGHAFLSSIKEAPIGTTLDEPGAIAVDHESGDLFVADPSVGVVDVFSSTGVYLTQFGGRELEAASVAVAEGSGLVYVADPFDDVVLVYEPNGSGGYALLSEWTGAGTAEGQFGEVTGVAVDSSTNGSDPHAGDVYVVDGANSVVDIFKPKPEGAEAANEGAFLGVLSGTLEEPNGVAVDSASGEVLVADSVKGFVAIYSAAGALEKRLTGAGEPNGKFAGPEEEEGNVAGVGVDEATGEIYVAETERRVVSQFNAEGKWIGWIATTPSGGFAEPRGVAVDGSGEVYVADALGAVVDVFGPDVTVADATTSPPSKVGKSTGTLNGVTNGDGKPAKYSFQYGASPALGSQTPAQSGGPGEEKVSAPLSSLVPGTTYFFRVVSENENGANYGAVREFTTLPAVEDVSTGLVKGLAPTEATLTGSLDPDGIDTHYLFEWGKSTSYDEKTALVDAGSGNEAVQAQATLTGLSPNTLYHYRLVGSDSFGTTSGADGHFTTSGPPRIESQPTSGLEHDAAIIHAKVDPGELESEYHFEYGETASYGSETTMEKLTAGEAYVAVQAALSKLKIGTTYHFRLVAKNSAGTTTEPDQTFTTVPPALIETEYASEVSASEATLGTQIDPLGRDTTYYFEYGIEPCSANSSACASIPSPPADLGAGETGIAESQHLEGLKPSSTYHYRVIATNTLGTSEGPEHTLTTQSATTPFALVDGRSWEMVTPPHKQAPLEALPRESGLILASEDGNAFTYIVNGALGEDVQGNRSPEWQQVLARRTPGGWTSQDIATPSTRAKGIVTGAPPEYQAFTPDLETALVLPPTATSAFAEPPLAPGVVQATMYLRDDAAGTYLPLVTEANVASGTVFGDQLRFLNGTPDLSHVVMSSNVALLGGSSTPGLYEWSADELQLVSVLPGGVPATGELELGYANTQANAISSDGTRVIWTKAESARAGHLYMRDTADGESIQLDAAQGVKEPSGVGVAHFQTATSAGSRVFFTDSKQLTPDSTAEPLSGKPDLYECEIVEEAGKPACKLSDLTVDANVGEHADVQELLLGSSEDGSTLYLVAQGVLSDNENGDNETAGAGKNNLYELHYDGARWTTTFIGELAGEDSPAWEGDRIANTAYLTARVSPNGRYLAFMSAASLTGYDNRDQNSGQPDEEVYLYDAETASLRCVSCNPTGARPVGVLDTENTGEGIGLLVDRRKVWLGHWLAGSIPGWTPESLTNALIQPRYLSDTGRLFFDSPDDLVPQASNHKENVYEYEPSGLGSCVSTTDGCVSLLSSGDSPRESAFLEATPDGSNVFFLTAQQLVPQDTDTAFDIYDARECTPSSPCLTPPQPSPPGCESSAACSAALPTLPAPIPASGTATFSGSGNLTRGLPSQAAKHEVKGVKSASKPPTRAQRLMVALKACKKHYRHANKKRAACEAHARKLDGPVVRPHKKKGRSAKHHPTVDARTRIGR